MARGAFRDSFSCIVRRISHDRSFSRYGAFKRKFVLIINVYFFEIARNERHVPDTLPDSSIPHIWRGTMVIESIETLRCFYMKVYLFGAYTWKFAYIKIRSNNCASQSHPVQRSFQPKNDSSVRHAKASTKLQYNRAINVAYKSSRTVFYRWRWIIAVSRIDVPLKLIRYLRL